MILAKKGTSHRAHSRASAINTERLLAVKLRSDSKGRQEKNQAEGKMTDCHRWRKERGETGWLVTGGAAGGVVGTWQIQITLEEGEQQQLL